MGCGDSKHDVATGNTVLQRKKSDVNSKSSKDIGTVHETNNNGNTTEPLAQRKESEEVKDSGGDDQAKDDVTEKTELLKEGDDKEVDKDDKEVEGDGDGVEEYEEAGRLISQDSPNQFFSSRKDEVGIDGIVSEGRSGKSEYYTPRSPRNSSGRNEDLLNDQINVKARHNAGEEKDKVVVVVEETKAKKQNVGAVRLEGKNLVKEAKPKTTVETSTPVTAEKKKQNAGKEKAGSGIPTKNVNTKKMKN